MSYFVFGVIDEETSREQGGPRLATRLIAERCAAEAGISVAIRSDREPSILAEMRGGLLGNASVPFLLSKSPGEDTSDALISPFVVGCDGVARAVQAIGDWVCRMFRDSGFPGMKIWLSEGFDDAFERLECSPDELAPLLQIRVNEKPDVPSLLISIRRRH